MCTGGTNLVGGHELGATNSLPLAKQGLDTAKRCALAYSVDLIYFYWENSVTANNLCPLRQNVRKSVIV